MDDNTSTEPKMEVRPSYRVALDTTTGIVTGGEWDFLSPSESDEGDSSF